jgi:hypothetical protein
LTEQGYKLDKLQKIPHRQSTKAIAE